MPFAGFTSPFTLPNFTDQAADFDTRVREKIEGRLVHTAMDMSQRTEQKFAIAHVKTSIRKQTLLGRYRTDVEDQANIHRPQSFYKARLLQRQSGSKFCTPRSYFNFSQPPPNSRLSCELNITSAHWYQS